MKKLFTLLFLCFTMITLVVAQEVYYSENFNAGLPDDWTVEGEWVIGTPTSVSSAYFPVPAADGNVACFNDDGLGSGVVGGGILTSGMIDLSVANEAAFLEFSSFFIDGDYDADERGIVHISTDGGTTWTQIAEMEGAADFSPIFIDISAYVGQSIWLGFEYDDGGGWNYGWAIDDISVADQITSIPVRSFGVHAGGATLFEDALEGIEYPIEGFIYNNGLEPINSYDITLSNGTDSYTESITNVEIPYNAADRFTMSQTITIEGSKEWTLTLSNVNGNSEADDDSSNDVMSFTLSAVSGFDENKAVLIEEATGTWCTWCPRGAAYLDEMSKRFGKHFVGVAVHNGDPMELTAYDSELQNFPGFPGYPSVLFERMEILDPQDILTPSTDAMTQAPPAALTVGATFDESTRTFVSSVEVNFLEDVSADHNVAIILTEDHVTGTGNGWDQINAYSGGGQGPMAGYEVLPSPIPGEFMIYNHVGRALIGGFDGVGDVVVGDFLAGDTKGYIFDAYSIPADYDESNMHVVAILINGNGEIVNATSATMEQALANGLTSTRSVFRNDLATVFPNPAINNATIELSMEAGDNVEMEVFNSIGQRLYTTDYGVLSGLNTLSLNTSNYANGIYTIHIKIGDHTSVIKKITVQK